MITLVLRCVAPVVGDVVRRAGALHDSRLSGTIRTPERAPVTLTDGS